MNPGAGGGSSQSLPRLARLAAALYRWILRFWDSELRSKGYDVEAAAVFRARLAHAARRSEGGSRVLRIAVRGLADALAEVLTRSPTHRPAPAAKPAGGRIPTWREKMGRILDDARLALRLLRRQPRFGALIVASFALAIGATAAAYSAVDGLLLRPLPFPDAERLLFIGELGANEVGPQAGVTSRVLLDRLDESAETLTEVAAYNIWEATLTGEGTPVRLSGAVVTAPYFDVLGRSPLLGRTFRPEDDVEGSPRLVVISHRLWRTRFGADPDVIGRVVRLNGVDYEIIGVMDESFESPDEYTFASALRARPDVWRTYRSTPPSSLGRSHRGIARIAPGHTLQQVRQELDVLQSRFRDEYPNWAEGNRIAVLPLQSQFTETLRPVLLLLLAAALFLLVAATVNVMSLVLARGIDRELELRVRRALGAGRASLLRQVAVEALVLGTIGGILGLALATFGIDAFLRVAPADTPRIDTIRLQPETVAVVLGAALLAAAAAGVIPGLRLFWGSASVADGGRGHTAGRARRRTFSVFAGVQVALAAVLLIGSGLLVRSFAGLVSVDPGYDPTNLVSVQLDLPAVDDPADRLVLVDEMLRRLEDDPMIRSAAMLTTLPQHGLNNFSVGTSVEGYQGEEAPWAYHRRVTDSAAEALGMRLLEGRFPRRADATNDGETRATAAAVSREFVRRYIGDAEPLGLSIGTGFGYEARIVGVVDNVKFGWPGEDDAPAMYLPVVGEFSPLFLVLRSTDDVEAVPARVRDVVGALAPGVPVDDIFFQERLLDASMAKTRTTMTLMLALGATAAGLVMFGLYGIVAHGVARRRREVGVRLALGATAASVVSTMVGDGLRAAIAGAAVGFGAAYAVARFAESLLFGVDAHDPVSFVGATVCLLLVALLACLFPARRAGNLHPVEALREE